MKKQMGFLLILLAFAAEACAGSSTTYQGLYKPDLVESGATWWGQINLNFDKIDGQLPGWIDARRYENIGAAVAVASGKNLIISTSQTLTGNLSVPADVHLYFLKGGMIVKASTYTVTFTGGHMGAQGTFQIFSGFLAGDITGLDRALPAWWGSAGDGMIDDSLPIQCAVSSLSLGGTFIGTGKTHKISTGITWKEGVSASWNNTILKGALGIKMINISNTGNWSWNGRIRVQGSSPGDSNTTIGVYSSAAVGRIYIQYLEGEDLPFVAQLSGLTNSKIDTVAGKNIFGKYQTNEDQAGSIIALTNSSDVIVDSILGYNVGKCAVYMGVNSGGNNTRININQINNVADPTKSVPSTLGIRSCIDCNFGQVSATNGYRAVGLQHEATDDLSWGTIYKINIGQINAKNIKAIGGIAVYISSENSSHYLDQITIGRMNLDTATSYLVKINRVVNSSFGEIIGRTADLDGLALNFSRNIYFGHVRMKLITGHSIYVSASDYIHFASIDAEDGIGYAFYGLNSNYLTAERTNLTNFLNYGINLEKITSTCFGHISLRGVGKTGIIWNAVTDGTFESIRALNVGTAADGTYQAFVAYPNCSGIYGNYVLARTTNANRHQTGATIGGYINIGRISTVDSTGHSLAPYVERGQAFVRMEQGMPYINRATALPAGTWKVGEKINYSDPIPGGWIGGVFDGSNWKKFGALGP